MNYARAELRDRLAAEYVLGTLHGGARRRFKRLLADDAELRATVAFWEAQLMPMAAPLSGPAPSPRLWERIEARVGGPARAAPAATTGWFERWFGTRALGGALAGLFVGVAVTLLVPELQELGPGRSQNQIPESYAGFLQDAAGNPTMLVSSRRHGKVVDIKVLRPISVGADQVLQLWALPKGGAPFRLGIVPAQGKGRIELPATSEQLLSKVSELAVAATPRAAPSAEPPAGPCAKFW